MNRKQRRAQASGTPRFDRIRPGADIDLEIRESMTGGVVRRVTDVRVYGRAYGDEQDVRAYGNTPALALCIAALRLHGLQKVDQ